MYVTDKCIRVGGNMEKRNIKCKKCAYFKEHRIKKAEGFISYSEPYRTEPKIKTSPMWCPKKSC